MLNIIHFNVQIQKIQKFKDLIPLIYFINYPVLKNG